MNTKIKRKKRNGCESAKREGRLLHAIVEGGGEEAQVKILYYESFVEKEEVLFQVERLKTWQDQLASTRSPDPFVGLPVDEQSPVRTSTRTNRALDFLKIKQVLLKGWTRQC